MSHWNHRIIKKTYKTPDYTEDEYGVYEVFYDENDEIIGWTMEPIRITGETKEDLRWVLDRINEAMKKEVLSFEELEKTITQKTLEEK